MPCRRRAAIPTDGIQGVCESFGRKHHDSHHVKDETQGVCRVLLHDPLSSIDSVAVKRLLHLGDDLLVVGMPQVQARRAASGEFRRWLDQVPLREAPATSLGSESFRVGLRQFD